MRNLSLICLFAVCLATSCSKNIQNLNVDTKHAVSVPPTSLFLAGEKSLSDNYTTTGIGTMPFRVFSQLWTETTYTTEARYILSAYNAPDGLWAAMYSSILNNLTDAKAAFPTTVKDPGTLRNDLIITDILEVYAYDILVATYGNIPYSQAENRSIPYPKYDDAKTVYTDLLTRLDTCIAGLSTASPAMGNSDQIYKGNIKAWIKFAATLKLKMAMLLADTDPSTAGKKVQEAVATGVFTSNNDNAKVAYQSSPTGNTNPIWQAVINSGRHDFCPGGLLVTTMNNWSDPRLPLYWTKAADGTYKGGAAGASNSAPLLSTFSAQWKAATYPSDLLDYAETEFLLVEAVERGFLTGGNTAEQYYDAAISHRRDLAAAETFLLSFEGTDRQSRELGGCREDHQRRRCRHLQAVLDALNCSMTYERKKIIAGPMFNGARILPRPGGATKGTESRLAPCPPSADNRTHPL